MIPQVVDSSGQFGGCLALPNQQTRPSPQSTCCHLAEAVRCSPVAYWRCSDGLEGAAIDIADDAPLLNTGYGSIHSADTFSGSETAAELPRHVPGLQPHLARKRAIKAGALPPPLCDVRCSACCTVNCCVTHRTDDVSAAGSRRVSGRTVQKDAIDVMCRHRLRGCATGPPTPGLHTGASVRLQGRRLFVAQTLLSRSAVHAARKVCSARVGYSTVSQGMRMRRAWGGPGSGRRHPLLGAARLRTARQGVVLA